MARNKKYFLARKILLGMMAASVLYGGAFVSQAEAVVSDEISGGFDGEAHDKKLVFDEDGKIDRTNSNLSGTYYDAIDIKLSTTPAEVKFNIRGGYSEYGSYTVTNNYVELNKSSLSGSHVIENVYGGYHANGDVTSNKVVINKGDDFKTYKIMGGYTIVGNSASKNEVIINNGTFNGDGTHDMYIVGGYSPKDATLNKVTINGGTFNNSYGVFIYGGEAGNGTATDNEVIITGGTFVGTSKIIGGMVSGNNPESITSGNKVNISGTTNITSSAICGGSNYNGTVSSNEVNITSGTLKVNSIFGGYLTSIGKIAEKNSVIITGGKVVAGQIYGGAAGAGIAKGNSVTIGGGAEVKGEFGGCYIYGGFADGEGGRAEGNTVTIGADLKNAYIYGGYGSKDAIGNKVIVKSGNISSEITGGYSNKGIASGNTLVLEGGTIESYTISGGRSSSGETTGNIVELRGTKVIGSVQGGEGPNAHDNIIKVYAGDLSAALLNSDKIEIHGKDLNIQHITDFNQLDFYIPKDAAAGDTLVNITGEDGTSLAEGTKVNAGVETGSNLAKGDIITLLKDEAGITNKGAITGKLTEGVSLEYDLDIAVNPNDITATIKSGGSGGMKSDTKSFAETGMASLAILNESADFIATGVMTRAQQDAEAANSSEMTPSFSAGGGKYRLNSGSHVDSKTYNMNLAFAKEVKNSKGKLMFAPFIEYGRGSYDSYLDNGVHGFGNSSFWGIGMMARQTNDDGFYYEGAIHGGNVKSDYDTNSLHDSAGKTPSYDRSNMFYAAHVGVGKVLTISEGNKLDYYGKLLYSHQNSSGATLGTGEHYDFGAIDSVRMLLGTKFTHAINNSSSIYAGVAWQQEFSGSSKARWRGMETDAPTLKGATGIMELGYTIKPDNSPVAIDLGLNGKIGKQKGFGVNAKIEWSF